MESRQTATAITILALMFAFYLLGGCKKEMTQDPGGGSGATPAFLELPPWVLDSLDPMPMPVDNPLTVEGIALGRRLFYEKALSDNYTQSCASCHVQSHGFSDPLAFSVGTNGATGTRNAMAVINLGWEQFFFWDGRRVSLEGQAHDPVTNMIEMRNTWPVVVDRLQADPEYMAQFQAAFGTSIIDSNLVVKAIAQFERTLLSFNSRYDRFAFEGDSNALSAQEIRGLDLFFRDAHCGDCHLKHRLTDGAMRNNGLDLVPVDSGLGAITGQPAHMGRFKVPTLRNIAATAPYMHDSRFTTLEEVLVFYANDVQIGAATLDAHMAPWELGVIDLDSADRSDIVAFLLALTDNAFLTDPNFAEP